MPEGPELRKSRDRLRFALTDPRPAFAAGSSTVPMGPAACNFMPIPGTDQLFGGRYRQRQPTGWDEFVDESHGSGFTVTNVDVKGKFMWWTLDRAGRRWYLHCTYGMSGQWTKAMPPPLHGGGQDFRDVVCWIRFSRVSSEFHTDDRILFVDQRHYGTLKFVSSEDEHQRKLRSLGPDMLADPCDAVEFAQRMLRHPDWTIGRALMDQSLVCGVGNYVRAESLYEARISPFRGVVELTGHEYQILWRSVCDTLRASYESGGATLRNYRDLHGGKGGSFQDTLKVYRREMCPRGHAILQKKTEDGRTAHFCPMCQR